MHVKVLGPVTVMGFVVAMAVDNPAFFPSFVRCCLCLTKLTKKNLKTSENQHMLSLFLRGGGGGGGATPICGPNKYVPPILKLWFVRVSNLKQAIIFALFSIVILL